MSEAQKPGTGENWVASTKGPHPPNAEAASTNDTARLVELHRACVATGMGLVLAHELSQPLSAIANYVEAGLRRLEQETVAREDLAQDLRKIKAQTLRAADLVRQLRGLVARGSGSTRREDLNELVTSACSLAECVARDQGIRVVLQLARNLPPVLCERRRTQHALVNLLQNAIDAIRAAGRREGVITVVTGFSLDETGRGAGSVTVRDNGTGIRPDGVARFLEPFFTTKEHGLGMGLTVSRALIEAQGGRLWLEPAGEAGIVHFTLPFAS